MNLQIEKTLKDKSIIEYLATHGHFPVKELGSGRYGFLCPFDDHKESKPSFVVYTNSEYENFHCYGCNRGFSIIHLVSFLNHISFSEALKRLSDGIIVPTEDEIKYIIDKIYKKTSGNPVDCLYEDLFKISWQCLLYSQWSNFDYEEIKIVDKYYEFIDENILEGNFDVIEESLKYLSSNLCQRKIKFGLILKNRKQKNLEEEIL